MKKSGPSKRPVKQRVAVLDILIADDNETLPYSHRHRISCQWARVLTPTQQNDEPPNGFNYLALQHVIVSHLEDPSNRELFRFRCEQLRE